MRKRKKIDSSTIILSSIIVFFTIIIFLSLPVLFNYKSIQNEIENKFFSEFKIKLKILDNISFNVLPRPHLLINRANLDFNSDDEKSAIIKVENLKLYIPTKKIYSKKNIEITDFSLENLILNLKLSDIKDIRNHLYNKKNKPIKISNLKIFLLDNRNNVILISLLNKINYQLNDSFTAKELKLKGSIFDIRFKSSWKIDYDKPKSSINEIDFKNPNIYVKNLFSYLDNNDFKGSSSLDFLNENISFNYNYKDEKIQIYSPSNKKNQKIKINSNIELDPFYFNGEIIFEEKKISFITDYILNLILNADKEFLENLDGELKLKLINIDSKLFNEGEILLFINEGKFKTISTNIKMNNIGILKSNYSYVIREGELYLKTKNILNISNHKELARQFQLNFRKTKKIKSVYFDFERNIDTGDMFITNFYFNDKNSQNFLQEVIKVNNMLVLKSTLRDILP